MTPDVILAIAGFALTIVLPIVGAAFYFGRVAGELSSRVAELRSDQVDLKSKLSRLEQVPILEMRLNHLEQRLVPLEQMSKDVTTIKDAVAALSRRISGEMRAVKDPRKE